MHSCHADEQASKQRNLSVMIHDICMWYVPCAFGTHKQKKNSVSTEKEHTEMRKKFSKFQREEEKKEHVQHTMEVYI